MVAEKFSIGKREMLQNVVGVASDETATKRLKRANFPLELFKLATIWSIVYFHRKCCVLLRGQDGVQQAIEMEIAGLF